MKKWILFILIFTYEAISCQNDVKMFISNITDSYKKEYNENFLKNIVKESLASSNIQYEEDKYVYFPVFNLEFRKLTRKERKMFSKHQNLEMIYNLKKDSEYKKLLGADSLEYFFLDRFIKKNYLSYIKTSKIRLNEIYVYRDSIFIGNIMKYKDKEGIRYKFREQTCFLDLYNKIIKINPILLFYVQYPSSTLYLVMNDDIMAVSSDKNILNIRSYIFSDDFDFGKIYLENK